MSKKWPQASEIVWAVSQRTTCNSSFFRALMRPSILNIFVKAFWRVMNFSRKGVCSKKTWKCDHSLLHFSSHCCYNPGQNYLRIFTPPCTLSNATTLFQQQLICGTKFPSPQVNVVSYKCLRIRVALEHTTTLLPRGGGKGGRGIARMLGKMVWECDIFSTVLSKIVACYFFTHF